VPAWGSAAEWFEQFWMGNRWPEYADFVNKTEHLATFSYADYATRFKAELYDPQLWSSIFARSGAQYIVLTSKHHDGYCLWNSSANVPATWNWNAMDVGPKRDLVGELCREVKNTTSPHTGRRLKFGIYHSLFEWFNPLYLQDKANQFKTQHFVDQKTLPELHDLVTRYDPDLLWSDGEWEASSEYWKSRQFLDWWRREKQKKSRKNAAGAAFVDGDDENAAAIWNDRWGNDTLCTHGSYLTCLDRYRPDNVFRTRKYENSFTIDRSSYGLNRNASIDDYYTTKELVHVLIDTVSKVRVSVSVHFVASW